MGVLEWVVRAWVDSVVHEAEGEVSVVAGLAAQVAASVTDSGGGFGRQGGGMGGGGPMGMMNGEKETGDCHRTVPTRNAAVVTTEATQPRWAREVLVRALFCGPRCLQLRMRCVLGTL